MPPERRAVVLLLGLALVGQALRTWAGQPGAPPGEVQLIGGGPPGIPRAHRDSALALARPLRQGERIDLDRASAAEITRLPRVGLTLARTIVADREAHGAFGSLEALDRVPGIGPGLLAAIRDQVTFSAAGRLGDSATRGRLPVEFGGLPTSDPIPQATPESPLAGRSRPAVTSPSRPAEPLDLNTATAAELERLPFVGPYMAQQIVAYRSRHGAFPAVDSLVKVPGIGPATLAKIRGRVSAN